MFIVFRYKLGLLNKLPLLRISVKHRGDFSNFHFPFTFFLYAYYSLFSLPNHFSLFLTMAQVAVSRSIQSTLLCPSSGSARDRAQNLLKPPSFSSTVLPSKGNNNKRSQHGLRSFQISGRKSAPSEVIPVSPEDDPKVRVFFCIGLVFLGVVVVTRFVFW